MDQKVTINEEPFRLEGTAGTSFPSADVKDEVIIDEHVVEQLVPCIKEEDNEENVAELSKVPLTSNAFIGNSNRSRRSFAYSQERPYHCIVCESYFSRRSSLRDQLLTHTREVQYKCKICREIFNTKSSIKMHLLSHTDGRLYSCDKCKRTFSQEIRLKVHLSVHCGRRLYNCATCRRSFARQNTFDQHLLSHSAERP